MFPVMSGVLLLAAALHHEVPQVQERAGAPHPQVGAQASTLARFLQGVQEATLLKDSIKIVLMRDN